MTDILLIMLGAGPSSSKEVVQSGTYRTTTYYFPEDSGEDVPGAREKETPFVGEALVELGTTSYDEVHIFGTAQAMWSTLLAHCGDPLEDEALIEALFRLEEEGGPLPELLADRIRTVVGDKLSTRIEPHLIPVGHAPGEYWEMMNVIQKLGITEGRISIDITHSIRAHPLFLLLAVIYLRALHERLEFGSVFYGAYVLRDDEDRAPILDLRPMAEMLNWIEAASAFGRYGDAAPVSDLLTQYAEDVDAGRSLPPMASSASSATAPKASPPASDPAQTATLLRRLADDLKGVSQTLQLNTIPDLQSRAGRLTDQLRQLDALPVPVDLIRPRLQAFPARIHGVPLWQAMLHAAREHWSSYRAGLAVISTWEAVLTRIGGLYGLPPDLERDEYRDVSALARDTDLRYYRQNGLREFPEKAQTLKDFRVSVAHATEEPGAVYAEFPRLLGYVEQTLGMTAFENMQAEVSLYERQ